ncbi:MAG: hypothetical protein IPM66_22930 [Acidobacteriota bacterium]|nr:MAG: hypothetical protein IPM66_22930 [Acidobacteriota bacterium]
MIPVIILLLITPASDQAACHTSRPVPVDRWRGEYYDNLNLSGSPAMVRDDGSGDLRFDWGLESPSAECGLGRDRFSVRWTRKATFAGGVFRFTLKADDGVRLLVDGVKLIDDWNDRSATTRTAVTRLEPGNHLIVLEYYENLGSALVDLSWRRHPCFESVALDWWKGEFFDRENLGAAPVAVLDFGAGRIDFPGPSGDCLRKDAVYSIRWSRRTLFNDGKYRFNLVSDAGARLFLDGRPLIDQWNSNENLRQAAEIVLKPGNHTVILEYRGRLRGTGVRLDWRWVN